jgi:hypothetical protein
MSLKHDKGSARCLTKEPSLQHALCYIDTVIKQLQVINTYAVVLSFNKINVILMLSSFHLHLTYLASYKSNLHVE